MIIPIGVQCTNATLKKKVNRDTKTLPFDWMLSNPKFVYEILKLLLESELTTEEIVENHFFCCNDHAKFIKCETYQISSNGHALYNSKYDVIFPHDKYDDDAKLKYIRRLDRLKDIILNFDEKLIFIYSSQSSLQSGNFTINDREIIKDVYFYLTKIYELINLYNNDFEMIVFDSILNENKNALHEKITLHEMNSCDNWSLLLHQILHKKVFQ